MNVMIISSDHTGHGHKSVADSINEQLVKYPGVNVYTVDGFNLGGNIFLKIGKLYGSVTRNAKDLWKLIWDISSKRPSVMNEMTEVMVRENFLKQLSAIKPDIILSVHPIFNGSILNILEERRVKIPFVSVIPDLVSISPLWADSRADYTICPTLESRDKCLEFGVPEHKLVVTGFPVREKFCRNVNTVRKDTIVGPGRKPSFLVMSGGEGSGNMSRTAKILLDNFDCNVRIVTGRNALLKKRLEILLAEKYNGRIEVFGFTENIQDLMLSSDILFVRGSPNVMMEAAMCNIPMVITGALPGQEEGNPGYALKYNLGVVCKDLKKMKGVVQSLLENGAQKLAGIKKSQREYRNPEAAGNIVRFVLELVKKAG